MKKLLIAAVAAACLVGCAQPPAVLTAETDNIPADPNWERIAQVSVDSGVYKVIDTEDGVICYYTVIYSKPGGISCLAYYHEGSKENYRQVDG